MTRPALAALLSLASAAALAACGGGGHSQPHTGAHAASAPAQPSPTRAEATAFARAVNLRPSDVPGLKASRKQPQKRETATERRLEAKLRLCTGRSDAGEIADLSSKEFKRQAGPFSQSVSSGVTVEHSAAVAARELSAIHAHNVRSCLSQYVQQTLESHKYSHVTIVPVRVAEGRPPAPGMTGSYGWRITSGLQVRGIRIPFYMDILGFVDGPADVSLVSFGIPRAFPAAGEEHLFRLLLQRASAHRL